MPQVVRSWSDMRQYGVEALTGESCGIGMRLLCDLTPEGVNLIESFFSIRVERGTGWNNQSPDAASIMLPYNILQPLAAFAILRGGAEIAVAVDHRGEGYSAFFVESVSVDNWEKWRETAEMIYRTYRIYRAAGDAQGGTRNQHYMSGRIE